MRVLLAVVLTAMLLSASTVSLNTTATFSSASANTNYYMVSSSGYADWPILKRSYQTTYPQYQVYNLVMSFDTSGLGSSATVQSASLTWTATSVTNSQNCSVIGDWYSGDLTYVAFLANVGMSGYNDAISGVAIASIPVGSSQTVALSNITNINKTAATKIRLNIRCSADQPTGLNEVYFSFPMSMAITYTVGNTRRLLIVGGD